MVLGGGGAGLQGGFLGRRRAGGLDLGRVRPTWWRLGAGVWRCSGLLVEVLALPCVMGLRCFDDGLGWRRRDVRLRCCWVLS